MPHLTVNALDEDLVGNEARLMHSITEAVVAVYGEWVRAGVSVLLAGWPRHRWSLGGRPVGTTPVHVTFGVREELFRRQDADHVVERLVAGLTEAIVSVFGRQVRERIVIELIATPATRIAIGGEVISRTTAGSPRPSSDQPPSPG